MRNINVFSKMRRGFTLLEVLIAIGIFTLVAGTFIAVLVSVLGSGTYQSASAEVSQQAQFLQSQIQYYIQNSRLADMPLDTVENALVLREMNSANDPTVIYIGGSSVNLVQDNVSTPCTGADPVTNKLNSTVNVNDLLVAYGVWESAANGNMTDSIGNTYTSSTAINWSGKYLQPWYAINKTTAASDTVSFTAGNNRESVLVFDYSGIATLSPLYATSTATSPSNSNAVSTPVAVSNPGDLVVGTAVQGGSPLPTTGEAGWTLYDAQLLCNEDQYAEGTTSTLPGSLYEASFNSNNPGGWAAIDLAFKAASAPTGTVYLSQGGATPVALTSSKVTISNLTFTRHYQSASSTAIGAETVSYSFTVTSNNGLQTPASQTIQGTAEVLNPVSPDTGIALVQKTAGTNDTTGIESISSTFLGPNEAGDLLIAVSSVRDCGPSGLDIIAASFKPQSGKTIYLSQSTTTTASASATTTVVAFSHNVTSSDMLVVMASMDSTTTITITDTQGNAWNKISQMYASGWSHSIAIFYSTSSPGGADTVTMTLGKKEPNRSLYVYEYGGITNSSPLDNFITNTAGTALVTSTQANELIIEGATFYQGSGVVGNSNPPGFILEGSSSFANSYYEDMVQPAVGLTDTNFSDQCGAVISDTQQNFWSQAADVDYLDTTQEYNIFYAPNAKAGGNAVTVTYINSTASYGDLFLFEYRGLSTAEPVVTSSITHYQSTWNSPSPGSSSFSLQFAGYTLPGDLITAAFSHSASTTIRSVTDSEGNTYVRVGSELTTPLNQKADLYYASNIHGGSLDTVSLGFSATDTPQLYLDEFSGVNLNTPLDVQAGATGTVGTALSGSATTTQAADLIYGFCLADSACTVGSTFTAYQTANGNLVEGKIANAAGSYNATGTANAGWSMQMAAFEPATTIYPVDASSTQIGFSSSTPGTGYATPSWAANELLFAVSGINVGDQLTSAGPGFVSEASTTDPQTPLIDVEDSVQYVTGPVQALWNYGTTENTANTIVMFH